MKNVVPEKVPQWSPALQRADMGCGYCILMKHDVACDSLRPQHLTKSQKIIFPARILYSAS